MGCYHIATLLFGDNEKFDFFALLFVVIMTAMDKITEVNGTRLYQSYSR